MMKSCACIALLFAVFVATQAGPGRGGPGGFNGGHGGGGRPGHGNQGSSLENILCNNASLASTFFGEVQQLITTLQGNGSFAQVLAARAQAIAYVTNSANTALLSSNCTAFFSGLQAAKQADQAAAQVQQQYFRIAGQALFALIQSVTGGGNHGDSNSNELF